MKKLFAIFTSTLLFLPLMALAHGGVSKNVGSYVVYLNQSPISPLVGEKVNMNFVIRDAQNNAASNLNLNLKLIDTFYGDESKDKIILTQNINTDTNGAFDFYYTFNKENYFDVDLNFVDPITKKALDTGFLVQPRAALFAKTNKIKLFVAALIGFLLASNIKNLYTKFIHGK